MRKPKIKIKQSTDGQFYFVCVAANNKIIATSETYKTLQGCRNGISALRYIFFCGAEDVVSEELK